MRQFRLLLSVLILALLMSTVLGCSNLGYHNGVVTMDVTLSADALNKIVDKVGIDSDGFVGKIEKVELIEPNILRITGDFKLLGKENKGSVDFALTLGNEGVQVDAVHSTIPGVDGNTPVVKTFSNALASALNAFVVENSDGGITDLKVKDGSLVITVGVKVK